MHSTSTTSSTMSFNTSTSSTTSQSNSSFTHANRGVRLNTLEMFLLENEQQVHQILEAEVLPENEEEEEISGKIFNKMKEENKFKMFTNFKEAEIIDLWRMTQKFVLKFRK